MRNDTYYTLAEAIKNLPNSYTHTVYVGIDVLVAAGLPSPPYVHTNVNIPHAMLCRSLRLANHRNNHNKVAAYGDGRAIPFLVEITPGDPRKLHGYER
jgi:hypothetical protein